MEHPVKTRFAHDASLDTLANHYTTRGAQDHFYLVLFVKTIEATVSPSHLRENPLYWFGELRV